MDGTGGGLAACAPCEGTGAGGELSSTASAEGSKSRRSELDSVLAVFQAYDENQSGTLEPSELKAVLQVLDPQLWTDDQVNRLMRVADRNCDGAIQFEEFLSWLFAVDDGQRQAVGVALQPAPTPLDPDNFDLTSTWHRQPETPFVGEQKSRARSLERFYELGERLAEGAIGVVYKATCKATGGSFAAKVVTKDGLSRLRRQGPVAQLAAADVSLHHAARGCGFLGQVECSDAPLARMTVDCKLTNSGQDMSKSMSFRLVGSLRRGEAVLHRVHILHVSVGPGATTHHSRTFPVRDSFIFSARRGDVYELGCEVDTAFRGDAGSSQVLPGDFVLDKLQVKVFGNGQATEAVNLLSFDHPNIVRILDVFEDFLQLYFCMELCRGGELFDAVLETGALDEVQVRHLSRQAFSGVAYMHSREVMHRDLCLQNLLLSEPLSGCRLEQNSLKIGGLGLSRSVPLSGKLCATRVGEAYYIAPEVLELAYDQACDVWALGVVCFILLTGRPPFDAETEPGIWAKIKDHSFRFELEEESRTSSAARDFVCQCLVSSRTSRWSAAAAMEGEWLRSGQLAPKERGESPTPAPPVFAMRHFWQSSLIRKAACSFVAKTDAAKLAELREIFEALDADRSGELTVADLRLGLETAGLGLGTGAEGWRRWLERTFGAEGDAGAGAKRISYTTFLASAMDQRTFDEEEACWVAFRGFDRDGSGSISSTELDEALRSLGDDMLRSTSEAIEQLRRQADLNKDGQIDFYEFVQAVRAAGRATSTESAQVWEVVLKEFSRDDLGLNDSQSPGHLCVRHVREGGLAHDWNRLCVENQRGERQIRCGDEIVGINGQSASVEAMLAQLPRGAGTKDVTLRVARHPAGCTEPGAKEF